MEHHSNRCACKLLSSRCLIELVFYFSFGKMCVLGEGDEGRRKEKLMFDSVCLQITKDLNIKTFVIIS